MPRSSFKIKFAPGTIRKLNDQIIKGINTGAEKYVSKLKESLKNGEQPNEWKSEGSMQNALIKTGMDNFTYPGRLLQAWNETIDNIKIDKRSNNVVMNLFNSRILDERTVWIGLKNRPIEYNKNREKKESTRRKRSISGTVPAIYNGGYRPIGRGKGNGWTWELNPYPENGYWLLYEQGWGQYQPHNFIKNSYVTAFGVSVADMLNESGNVAFDLGAIQRMKTLITDSINNAK